MKFCQMALWASMVLAASASGLRDLEELPFVNCGSSTHCADLYLCAISAAEWQCNLPSKVDLPPGNNGYLYSYKSSLDAPCVPGAAPVMRMKPGETYRVTLHNTGEDVLPDRKTFGILNASDYANREGLLHTTNLHLHGLHVSGQGDHDNVMRMVLPGKKLTYVYVLPSDLQGGTHWYHPHFHGKVNHQVIGGAFGMVVIEDQQEIGHPPVNGRPATDVSLKANTVALLTRRELEKKLVAYSHEGFSLGNGELSGENMVFQQSQWYRLRIAHVKPAGTVAVTKLVDPSTGMTIDQTSGCEAYELAYDGVYLTKVPYLSGSYEYSVHGGARLDLAVKCSVKRTVHILYDGKKVASIAVGSFQPLIDASPFHGSSMSWWFPVRPTHLENLLSLSNPVADAYDLAVSSLSFNEKVPTKRFPFGDRMIQPINLKGTKQHPVHMHQQHFQVVQSGGCGSAHRYGEFYDTISHTGGGDCLVLTRFVDFSGPTIIHCHVLTHEDQGMMGWFDIPFGAVNSFEASSDFSNMEISKKTVTLPATTTCLDVKANPSEPLPDHPADICNGPAVRSVNSLDEGIVIRAPYGSKEKCHTLLQAADGQRLRITFDFVNTELNYDSLRIYDGQTPDDQTLLAVSGKDLPEVLETTGNVAYLQWVTDDSTAGDFRKGDSAHSGWALKYSALFGQCSDSYPNWVDNQGDSCDVYAKMRYCTREGGYGTGWDFASWGRFEDYSKNGGSAADYCCQCGGGRFEPCEVGEWSEWSASSATCGTAVQRRTRFVSSGPTCPPAVETRQCNLAPCPTFCLATADIKKFPTYTGTLNVKGTFYLQSFDDKNTQVVATLTGLEPSVNAGWHLHAGFSCDTVGGHYFPNANMQWSTERYDSNSQGVASIATTYSPLNVGQAVGHALVVHAKDGTNIGCAVVRYTSDCAVGTADAGTGVAADTGNTMAAQEPLRSESSSGAANEFSADASASIPWPIVVAVVCGSVLIATGVVAGLWWLRRHQVADLELPAMLFVEVVSENEVQDMPLQAVPTPQAKSDSTIC